MDRAAVHKALGREFYAERIRRGWSRKELSAHTDGEVSFRQIGKIERGEAGQLDEVLMLAQILGVSFARLATAAERRVAEDTGSPVLD